MGTILFVLFALAEIGLVVFTFAYQKEQRKWLRNRTYIRIAEALVILLIMVLPGIYNKFRFTAALCVLVIRLAYALLMYALKKQKVTGEKKIPQTVISCIGGLLLIGLSLVPAFVITGYHGLPTTGEYAVKQAQAILVDKTRTDEFENDGSYREVPVHFYYPAEGAADSSPLVLFSHGAFGYYQSNTSTYFELASHGYVVVSLDHTHHAFFTKDTDGKIITVDPEVLQGAIDVTNGDISGEEAYRMTHEWLDLRVADQSFVLDSLKQAKSEDALNDSWYLGSTSERDVQVILSKMNPDKIGIMGHSLGGAASVASGRIRDDIDAVIDLDGTMFGEEIAYNDGDILYVEEPYPVPVLEFSNESEHNAIENTLADGKTYANDVMMKNALDGLYIWLKGTEHMDFTDLPMFSPLLGSMLGSGERDTRECMTIVNSLILEFYDYYLKGNGELNFQQVY